MVAEEAGRVAALGAGRAESPVAAGEDGADEAGPAGAIAPFGDARTGATGGIPRVIPGVSRGISPLPMGSGCSKCGILPVEAVRTRGGGWRGEGQLTENSVSGPVRGSVVGP